MAVKLAKNLTYNELPSNLTLGGKPVAGCDVANSFAKHFNEKIKLNVSKTRVDANGVYETISSVVGLFFNIYL